MTCGLSGRPAERVCRTSDLIPGAIVAVGVDKKDVQERDLGVGQVCVRLHGDVELRGVNAVQSRVGVGLRLAVKVSGKVFVMEGQQAIQVPFGPLEGLQHGAGGEGGRGERSY